MIPNDSAVQLYYLANEINKFQNSPRLRGKLIDRRQYTRIVVYKILSYICFIILSIALHKFIGQQ